MEQAQVAHGWANSAARLRKRPCSAPVTMFHAAAQSQGREKIPCFLGQFIFKLFDQDSPSSLCTEEPSGSGTVRRRDSVSFGAYTVLPPGAFILRPKRKARRFANGAAVAIDIKKHEGNRCTSLR